MNMFSYPKETNKTISSSSTNTEEFSFPVINSNPLSSFMLSSSSASSSSLWRISSRVYHHYQEDYYDEDGGQEAENEDYDHYYDRREVRSMCDEILPSRRSEIDRSMSFQSNNEFKVEESMDYLWENHFNQEEIKDRKSISGEDNMGVMEVAKMDRKSSNSNSSSSSTKMLVIGKLLKRLVSIRKSAQLKAFKTKISR